jgi:hypothetical protein
VQVTEVTEVTFVTELLVYFRLQFNYIELTVWRMSYGQYFYISISDVGSMVTPLHGQQQLTNPEVSEGLVRRAAAFSMLTALLL